MLSQLIVLAALSQMPVVGDRVFTNDEMVFKTVNGQKYGYHPEFGWAPVTYNPKLPPGMTVMSMETGVKPIPVSIQGMTPAIPTKAKSGPGSGTGTGGGKGGGGGAVSQPAVVAKTIATPAEKAGMQKTVDLIKKAAEVPKGPDGNKQGKDRWEYSLKRMDTVEIQTAELKSEISSLKDVTKTLGEALEGLVKILEKK